MEIKRRTWTKALTWQALGLLVMTLVNYIYLGNLQQGLGLSVLLAGLGLVTYVAHEWLWSRVRWGLRAPTPGDRRPSCRSAAPQPLSSPSSWILRVIVLRPMPSF